jgi:tetratricopeptide (TPR) repeat protein
VGGAHARLAQMYRRLSRYQESLEHVRPAIEIFTKLGEDRNNINWLRNLFAVHDMLGDLFNVEPRLAAPGEEKQNLDIDVSLADRLLASDPQNTTALYDVALAQGALGLWYMNRQQDAAASVAPFRRSVESIEKYASLSTPGIFAYDALLYAHDNFAEGLSQAGRFEEAMAEIRKGEAVAESAEKQTPGTLLLAARRTHLLWIRAECSERQKKWPDAIADYKAAIASYEALLARDPKNGEYLSAIATLLASLADSDAAMEQWDTAAGAAETAIERFRQITLVRPLSENEERSQKDCRTKVPEWKLKAASMHR